MTEAERRDRASHRCKPHLDTALKRMIDHGVTTEDACRAMLMFGAVVMVEDMTTPDRRRTVIDAVAAAHLELTRIAMALGRQAEVDGQGQGGV